MLVTASQLGDQQAWAGLVRRHIRRLFAICLAIVGEQADAEDAVQETFVKGYQHIRGVQEPDRFAAWIDQIARNTCRDLLRRRQRRPEVPLTTEVEQTIPVDEDEFGDLRTALSRLSEKHRVPLILYYFEGKSTRMLAEELGLSEGGACARLYRARLKLRALLEEEAIVHE